MKKSFSLFLALRYLKPKRTFVSVITLISILGVTLGITVLIVVMSVMRGFELKLQEKVIGFEAHITVENGGLLDNWRQIAKELENVPGVVGVAPYTHGPALAQFKNHRLVPMIQGIDPGKESKITEIKKYLVASSTEDKDGNPELDLDGDNCVVGADFAQALELSVGDTLHLTSGGNVDQIIDQLSEAEKNGEKDPKFFENIKQMVLPMDLKVTGIFSSGRYAYDSNVVLVPLHIGQEIYELGPSTVHGLAVKTSDPFTVNVTKQAIMAKIGPPNLASTWMEKNKDLFDAIRMERSVMFFILMFIVLVAAFGIMNTQITVTVQKTREIGILKALGAQTHQIIGIFLAQGMVIGFFGTLTGLALGMTLIRFRNETRDFLSDVLGIPVFPKSVYEFSEIPAAVASSDVAIICVSAFVICSLAALIPAYFAARLDPVKALRSE